MVEELVKGFLEPSGEFSPIPFWFWNDSLTQAEINRQLTAFHEKGIDGFVIHARMGLPKEIEYLSEEFFHYVRYAIARAKELQMKVVLYDEAMYPSGSCHGEVVQENAAYASKGLRMSTTADPQPGEALVGSCEFHSASCYFYMGQTGGTIRGVHYGEDDGEANAPKSADLLNPEAVACFIRLTHERYYEHLKEYFGNTVIAMFTDEPNIIGRCAKAGRIPWSEGFLEEFIACGGQQKDLPYLFDDTLTGETALQDSPQAERQRAKAIYQKAIYKRMSLTYYGQISAWCKAHGIAMTGHPEKSTDIGYLQYFDIPCQDIVWRFVAPAEESSLVGEHSTMGKCSADSARHRGKRRNGNECFGCCGHKDDPYKFTREDMKWYLDWLFVRGVNMVYPHAFYYSLRDRRKEERPPEVGMHSEFWNEYHDISDYIKRMCYMLTDAVNQTTIAILCKSEELSWKLAKPLYENQIEFNYLEEELLKDCKYIDGGLQIEKQKYHIILSDENISEETGKYLRLFEQNGGILIQKSPEESLAAICEAIRPEVVIAPKNPKLRYTHVKKQGEDFYIFANEGEDRIDTVLTVEKGEIAQIWNPEKGTIASLPESASTMDLHLDRRKSIIFRVQNAEK